MDDDQKEREKKERGRKHFVKLFGRKKRKQRSRKGSIQIKIETFL